MKILKTLATCALLTLSLPLWAGNALVDMLTSQLGVTPRQASGGASALLGAVRPNLGGNDYSRLLQGAPALADLAPAAAQAAPAATASAGKPASGGSSWSNMVNSASSLLGGQSATLDSAAKLAKTFDGLGLTPDMVGKFAKVTYDYVAQTGGAGLADLFKGALPFGF